MATYNATSRRPSPSTRPFHDGWVSVSNQAVEDALDDAAEALREVEIEAALPSVPRYSSLDLSELEAMNIDELRALAKELDVTDRATITEKSELIAAIRERV